MGIGTMAALIFWRRKVRKLAYARWLVLLFLAVPPYIHSLAWSTFGLQGWIGAWWVELVSLLSLATGLAILSLESVEPVLIDAARLNRPDKGILKEIILPSIYPTLLAGWVFLFLFCLMDYTIPSLFSVNVYALEIFAEYSSTNEPLRAFLLGFPLFIIALIVVMSLWIPVRRAAVSLSRVHAENIRPLKIGGWIGSLEIASLAIVLLQIIVPLATLLIFSGTPARIVQSVFSAKDEFLFSLFVGFSAALISLPLGLAVADKIAKGGKRGYLWLFLVILPLLLPGPLVGIGLIGMAMPDKIFNLYGSIWMPVLSSVSRFAPIAALVILAKLQRTDRLLLEASSVHQRRPLEGFLRVRLPIFSSALMAAGFIVFIFSLGELASAIIVSPPGHSTLAIRIYNYLHFGNSKEVAGLCLVMILMILSAGAVIIKTAKGKR
jgi:iron(III) transport system permease protein